MPAGKSGNLLGVIVSGWLDFQLDRLVEVRRSETGT